MSGETGIPLALGVPEGHEEDSQAFSQLTAENEAIPWQQESQETQETPTIAPTPTQENRFLGLFPSGVDASRRKDTNFLQYLSQTQSGEESPPLLTCMDSKETLKCTIRYCRNSDPSAMKILCAKPGCNKYVHPNCYDSNILARNELEHFVPDKEEPYEEVACTMTCYRWLLRNHNTVENLSWNCDGKNGTTDPNNSENLLLDWLTTYPNYEEYTGNSKGQTKTIVVQRLIRWMESKGVRKKRSVKSVQSKIDDWRSQYNVAKDWADNTGVGVWNESKERFVDAVTSKFRYYYILDNVFGERAGSSQIVSSDDPSALEITNSDDDADDIAKLPSTTNDATPAKRKGVAVSLSSASKAPKSAKSGKNGKNGKNGTRLNAAFESTSGALDVFKEASEAKLRLTNGKLELQQSMRFKNELDMLRQYERIKGQYPRATILAWWPQLKKFVDVLDPLPATGGDSSEQNEDRNADPK